MINRLAVLQNMEAWKRELMILIVMMTDVLNKKTKNKMQIKTG